MKLKFNNKLLRTQGGKILTFKKTEPTEIKYGLLYNWWATQDQGTLNDIAPAGFRLPTEDEWNEERLSWSSNNAAGAFGSVLKLTKGGVRNLIAGLIVNVEFDGFYWSSTVNSTQSKCLNFINTDASILSVYRSNALSIRLIKDESYLGIAFSGGTFNGLEYQLVTNPTTGRVWLDRNLGATQVATSSTDSAAYGDLYQWGRSAEGHQLRTSDVHDGAVSKPSTYNESGAWDGKFIKTNASPYDWINPQNDNLWQGAGSYNIIPTAMASEGWAVPSDAQWTTLVDYLGGASIAGGKLKEIGEIYWTGNTGATNEVGFNLRGSGYRATTGFEQQKRYTFVWSGTQRDSLTAFGRDTLKNDTYFYAGSWWGKYTGQPLRLVRPATASEQLLPDGIINAYYYGTDGKIYRCTKIGTQVWLADNLAETKWSNGTWIQGYGGGVYTIIDNATWTSLTTAAVCAYNNQPELYM